METSHIKILTEEQKISWQVELARAIKKPELLFELLNLNKEEFSETLKAAKNFPLNVPYPYVQKIKPGDPNDPLLLQVLPKGVELKQVAGYSYDPLQEQRASKIPGLLHKYHGRVLLILTGACAINCRFCFRRHFPYYENRLNKTHLKAIFDYLQQDTSITEVILSGGDPLIATDAYIDKLINQLRIIPHLTRLRIHSRLPIMLPQRITSSLINSFIKMPQCIFVLHCNHPNEIDKRIINMVMQLKQAGITVLNQTVLLHKINDNAHILADLNQKLFASGVLPYYLHILDKIDGTAHFDIPLSQAKKIYSELQLLLPGYLVPKLVRETPECLHKVLIT